MSSIKSIDLATVKEADLQPLMNCELILRNQLGSFAATLIEISGLPNNQTTDEDIRENPFSVVFHCESGSLNQGMYTLEHNEQTLCDIFLSPFEGGEGWCKLEALFN